MKVLQVKTNSWAKRLQFDNTPLLFHLGSRELQCCCVCLPTTIVLADKEASTWNATLEDEPVKQSGTQRIFMQPQIRTGYLSKHLAEQNMSSLKESLLAC